MKAIITILAILLIGWAAWMFLGDDEIEVGTENNNGASVIEAIQNEGDDEIELGEFQDKG